MHAVAEAGVAAHWLYKAHEPERRAEAQRLGTMWLQSLLDIQDETRDAAEFLEHVKVDLFPDAVYVFTPKSQDHGAAARRDARSTSPTRSTPTSATTASPRRSTASRCRCAPS